MGRWDIRGTNNNVVSATLSTGGHPYNLIKTGSNQISMVAVSVDPQLANVDIQQGMMGWETSDDIHGKSGEGNLIVRAGATLSSF